jgi:hypothetical protein
MKEFKYNQKTIADRLQKIYNDSQGSDYVNVDSNLDHVLLEIKNLSRIIRPDETFFINARFLPVVLTKTINASAFCPDEDEKLRKFLYNYQEYSVDVSSMTSTIRSGGWCFIAEEESTSYRVQITMKPNQYGL